MTSKRASPACLAKLAARWSPAEYRAAAPDDGWPPMAPGDYRRHLARVRALCDEVDRPFDEVAEVYQCELQRMLAQSSVADYLPVLVGKHVRQWYKRRLQARAQGDPGAHLLALH